MIALRNIAHPFSYLQHDTGRLVTEHRRQWRGNAAMHGVQIAMAHAAGDSFHQHFIGTRLGDLDVLNAERLV